MKKPPVLSWRSTSHLYPHDLLRALISLIHIMSSVSHTGDQDSILRLQVGNSWAEVALYGSTVIGWHCENHSSDKDKSLIFLSRDTKPGKPFRGGIPLVFPVFGEVKDHANVPDTLKDAPRHGFCRDRNWIVTEKHDQDASKASVTMCEWK